MSEVLFILITALLFIIISFLTFFIRKTLLLRTQTKPLKMEVKLSDGERLIIEFRDNMSKEETDKVIQLLESFVQQPNIISLQQLQNITSPSIYEKTDIRAFDQQTKERNIFHNIDLVHIRQEQQFRNFSHVYFKSSRFSSFFTFPGVVGVLLGAALCLISYLIVENRISSNTALLLGQLIIAVVLGFLSATLIGFFKKPLWNTEISREKILEEERSLWLASRQYINGEISVDELEEIEFNKTEEFNQSLKKLAQLSF